MMTMETKTLTCITCPMGCELTAELNGGVVTAVTGNTCPRGAVYAKEELTEPKRMLTSTVRIDGGCLPLLIIQCHQLLFLFFHPGLPHFFLFNEFLQ